ncbi:MAG: hypothetical protein ACP5I4_09830, partial [Oceanipulchritudo sp.]
RAPRMPAAIASNLGETGITSGGNRTEVCSEQGKRGSGKTPTHERIIRAIKKAFLLSLIMD